MNVDTVADRVRAEFVEMPGLTLTVRQASRLFGLDRTCAGRSSIASCIPSSCDGPAPASWRAATARLHRKAWPRPITVPGMPPPARNRPARSFSTTQSRVDSTNGGRQRFGR